MSTNNLAITNAIDALKNALLGVLPGSLGQKTMQFSQPVVVASDQTAIPVVAQSTSTLNAATLGTLTDAQRTIGNALGPAFTLPNMARVAGGGGILNALDFENILPDASPRAVAVTMTNASSTITKVAHGLKVGNRVRFDSSANGFTTTTDYYVATVPTVDTFTVAASLGGSAVTSTGAAAISMTVYPAQLPCTAILFNAAVVILDNGQVDLTAAQSGTFVMEVPLTNQSLVAISSTASQRKSVASATNLGRPYKCAGGDTNLYGVLVYTGTTGASYSTGTTGTVLAGVLKD